MKRILIAALMCCTLSPSDGRPVPAHDIMHTAPYLQNPSPTAVTVMWHTTVPCHSWVEVGTDPAQMTRVANMVDGVAATSTNNRVRLEGLLPGTTYYYRVCSRQITLNEPYHKQFGATAASAVTSFKTLDDRATDFTAIIFNDLHHNMELFDQLCTVLSGTPHDLVIFNGDFVNDVQTEHGALAAIDHYCRGMRGDQVPCIFMRGNHELRGAYSPFLWNLLERRGGCSFGAFNVGDTRFVLLDTGEDKPDNTPVYGGLNDFSQYRLSQRTFLEQEMGSREFRRAEKRVLLHHIPIYDSAIKFNPCRDLWGGVLLRARFAVALNGHTHHYAWLPAGSAEGNTFPVMIGGGPSDKSATVAVLTKRGKILTLKVLDAVGRVLHDEVL